MPHPPTDMRGAVRARIAARGFTQAEVCRMLHKLPPARRLSAPMLRLFLNQDKPISTDRLEALCAALGLRVQLVPAAE